MASCFPAVASLRLTAQHADLEPIYRGTLGTLRKIYVDEGIQGLYRLVLHCAAYLPAYLAKTRVPALYNSVDGLGCMRAFNILLPPATPPHFLALCLARPPHGRSSLLCALLAPHTAALPCFVSCVPLNGPI